MPTHDATDETAIAGGTAIAYRTDGSHIIAVLNGGTHFTTRIANDATHILCTSPAFERDRSSIGAVADEAVVKEIPAAFYFSYNTTYADGGLPSGSVNLDILSNVTVIQIHSHSTTYKAACAIFSFYNAIAAQRQVLNGATMDTSEDADIGVAFYLDIKNLVSSTIESALEVVPLAISFATDGGMIATTEVEVVSHLEIHVQVAITGINFCSQLLQMCRLTDKIRIGLRATAATKSRLSHRGDGGCQGQ